MTFYDIMKNIFLLLIILSIAPTLVSNIGKQYGKYFEPRTKVGVLPIRETITNSESYNKQLRTYFEDSSIKAILNKMECSGGASGSVQSIYTEILALKKENASKPVIVLVENICASGGYNIACAADYVVAPGSALIGSIGTSIPYLFKINKLMGQINIEYTPVATGKYKNVANPFVPGTKEETALLQGLTDDSYQQFLLDVSQSRKLSLTKAEEWAEGKIFTGRQAIKLGLIDEIGSMDVAIKALRKKALIEGKIEWIHPPKKGGLMAFLRGEGSQGDDESLTAHFASAVCDKLQTKFFAPCAAITQ